MEQSSESFAKIPLALNWEVARDRHRDPAVRLVLHPDHKRLRETPQQLQTRTRVLNGESKERFRRGQPSRPLQAQRGGRWSARAAVDGRPTYSGPSHATLPGVSPMPRFSGRQANQYFMS